MTRQLSLLQRLQRISQNLRETQPRTPAWTRRPARRADHARPEPAIPRRTQNLGAAPRSSGAGPMSEQGVGQSPVASVRNRTVRNRAAGSVLEPRRDARMRTDGVQADFLASRFARAARPVSHAASAGMAEPPRSPGSGKRIRSASTMRELLPLQQTDGTIPGAIGTHAPSESLHRRLQKAAVAEKPGGVVPVGHANGKVPSLSPHLQYAARPIPESAHATRSIVRTSSYSTQPQIRSDPTGGPSRPESPLLSRSAISSSVILPGNSGVSHGDLQSDLARIQRARQASQPVSALPPLR